jgi:ornithine carbamoyltransferase
MYRCFAHGDAVRMAGAAKIPVINALSDRSHPCQGMADIFTLREHKGGLAKLKLTYVGDGNNVCHSLMLAAAKAGTRMGVATPKGYEPDPEFVRWSLEDGKDTGFTLQVTNDPLEAAVGRRDLHRRLDLDGAGRRRSRVGIFPFRSTPPMALAKPDAIFMHCLPAHRGEEVSAEVFESPASVVFDEAENRLHVQKAIMLRLMGKKEK